MKDHYGKHALEPVWQPGNTLRRCELNTLERNWLLDDSSLTRRLQQVCPDHFRVELLSQHLDRPMLSEARALGRPPREIALVRQIRMHCGNRPMVFARTVIPLPSLHGGLNRLALLGTKPLGAILFADPKMQRQPLEITRVTPRHRIYPMAGCTPNTAGLWGRRSVFTLHKNTLLVSEFFLPTLLNDTQDQE